MKPLNEMNTAEFIGHIEDWGCHCDLLNNFTCGHSAIIFELAERLNNKSIIEYMKKIAIFYDCVTKMAKVRKDCGHPILAMQDHCLTCHEKAINILLQRVKQLEDEKCQKI